MKKPKLFKPTKADSRFVPMLFSTPMVKAILNGTKTETRRIIDVDNSLDFMGYVIGDTKRNGQVGFGKDVNIIKTIKPKVNIGDIIWVRETFYPFLDANENKQFAYKADDNLYKETFEDWQGWKPSLSMPKKACRLFLEVVSVSVERLNDISDSDAISEGIYSQTWIHDEKVTIYENYLDGKDFFSHGNYGWNFNKQTHSAAVASYCSLWESINGDGSWNKNPFVWVYKFRSIPVPPDFC